MTQGRLELEAASRLSRWAPQDWPVTPDWEPLLREFWASSAARQLGDFVRSRLAAGATIYPPHPLRALALTPLAQVRVLIMGQDPYHGPGQAEGLAFSVPTGVRPPPSLRNIFKELARDPALIRPICDGECSLVNWARQGVLLLNTCLTVEDGLPASHAGKGWEVLTDLILRAVCQIDRPRVWMLWGAHAQKKWELLEKIGQERQLVLSANHPSPLSATRGPRPFMGCAHFSLANAFLRQHGEAAVQW